jgi:hypothetical protein
MWAWTVVTRDGAWAKEVPVEAEIAAEARAEMDTAGFGVVVDWEVVDVMFETVFDVGVDDDPAVWDEGMGEL